MIETRSTTEAVVEHFLEEIQQGRLSPGSKLPSERVLQKELGVSRFSLREGLARLSALGVIDIRQGKGAVVADEISSRSLRYAIVPFFPAHDIQNLDDLLEARMLLESELAALAATRRTQEDIKALEQILERAEETLNDRTVFSELDFQFHREVARIARNGILVKMYEAIADHAANLIVPAVERKHREDANNVHKEILECIRNGNALQATAKSRQHLVACMKNYQVSLRERKKKHSPEKPRSTKAAHKTGIAQ